MSARCVKQGFLLKRSDVIKTWNRRYVVLTPEYLEWFKEVGEGEGSGVQTRPQSVRDVKQISDGPVVAPLPPNLQPLRSVALQDVTSITRSPSMRQDNMLTITTSDPTCREILLAASSWDELTAWESAIRNNWRESLHAKSDEAAAAAPVTAFLGAMRDRTGAFLSKRAQCRRPEEQRAQECVELLISMVQVGTDRLPTVTWQPDSDATQCPICGNAFTSASRFWGTIQRAGSSKHARHHCRTCGIVICGQCVGAEVPLSFAGVKSFAKDLGDTLDIQRYAPCKFC
jgi:PH domain/FYVE zinc finger